METIRLRDRRKCGTSALPDGNYVTQEQMFEQLDYIKKTARPSVTIVGAPSIVGGSVSNFSADDYLVFPSVVSIEDATVEFDLSFHTGSDVTSQQNILDSDKGLALAIRGGKFVLAGSVNGTSFETEVEGGAVTPNTSYRIRLRFEHVNGVHRVVLQNSDGMGSYTDVMVMELSNHIYAKPLYFGGANPANGVNHIFGGTINIGECSMTYNGVQVWTGWFSLGVIPAHTHNISDIVGAKNYVAIEMKPDWYVPSGLNMGYYVSGIDAVRAPVSSYFQVAAGKFKLHSLSVFFSRDNVSNVRAQVYIAKAGMPSISIDAVNKVNITPGEQTWFFDDRELDLTGYEGGTVEVWFKAGDSASNVTTTITVVDHKDYPVMGFHKGGWTDSSFTPIFKIVSVQEVK